MAMASLATGAPLLLLPHAVLSSRAAHRRKRVDMHSVSADDLGMLPPTRMSGDRKARRLTRGCWAPRTVGILLSRCSVGRQRGDGGCAPRVRTQGRGHRNCLDQGSRSPHARKPRDANTAHARRVLPGGTGRPTVLPQKSTIRCDSTLGVGLENKQKAIESNAPDA